VADSAMAAILREILGFALIVAEYATFGITEFY
jgi:hypothetical protein